MVKASGLDALVLQCHQDDDDSSTLSVYPSVVPSKHSVLVANFLLVGAFLIRGRCSPIQYKSDSTVVLLCVISAK